MDSPVKKIKVANKGLMCTVVSSWLRSSYTGSSSCGLTKEGVLTRIIFADLPVLRYVPCAAVSRSIAKTSKSWRIKVIAFRIAVTVISVRYGTLSNSQKNAVSRCSDTQDRKLSRPCIHSRVDMNMITQLRFDYAVALRLRTRCSNATAMAARCRVKAAVQVAPPHKVFVTF